MSYLFAFFALLFLDFIWAEYTKAVTARRVWAASSLAGVLYLLGGLMAIAYVGNHWILLPAAAGSFAGTFLSVRRSQ